MVRTLRGAAVLVVVGLVAAACASEEPTTAPVEVAEAVEDAVGAAEDSVVPAEDDVVSAEDDVEPAEDEVEHAEDEAGAVEDSVVPAEDEAGAVEDSVVASALLSVGSATMSNLFNGLASGVGSSLFSWAISSMGSTNGETAELDEILDELKTINQTLLGIDVELTAIEQTLLDLDCDTEGSVASNAIAAIEVAWAESGEGGTASYTAIMNEATGSTPLVDTAALAQWADLYFKGGATTVPLTVSMTNLTNALYAPGGGATGVIEACLIAYTTDDNIPQLDTYDDRVYWCSEPDNTQSEGCNGGALDIINYYYLKQLKGMIMVAEAAHYQAWVATEDATEDASIDPNEIQSVCISSSATYTAEAGLICGDITMEMAFYYDGADANPGGGVLGQWTLVGSPYRTVDSVPWTNLATTVRVGKTCLVTSPSSCSASPTHLWPGSLESFNDLSTGGDCVGSDSDTNVCGPTIGDTEIDDFTGSYGDAYTDLTWGVVDDSEMDDVFSDWDSGLLSDYMNQNGFADVGDYIVLFPKTIDTTAADVFKDAGWGCGQTGCTMPKLDMKVQCFFATNWTYEQTGAQPFCDDVERFANLTRYDNTNSACIGVPEYYTPEWSPLDGHTDAPQYDSFYAADLHPCPDGGDGPPAWFDNHQPLWNHHKAINQFHWPKIEVASADNDGVDGTVQCINGYSPTNAAGVPSICGANFTQWLDAQVPAPSSG